MRRAWLAGIMVLLLVPAASAWRAEIVSAPEGISLRDALLLAGSIDARTSQATFGAPSARQLLFDTPAAIQMCPDRVGEPEPQDRCANGDRINTGARLYIHAGGVIVNAPAGSSVSLHAAASAAALGGPNVTIAHFLVGAAVYAGGPTVIDANASTFVIRPLTSGASIEVRGDDGFHTYNGTAYTLYVSNVTSAHLEAKGAFLGGESPEVSLSRAGTRQAENGIVVDALYDLIHALQPAENADRRADLSGAFGPFQVVPALLDGAAAARQNLTLNGQPRSEFTLVRLQDAQFVHDGGNWTGQGNATYLVDDVVVARSLDASPRFPVILPAIFLLAALAGRLATDRAGIPRGRRITARSLRLAGLVVLTVLAAAALRPLLGFAPLFEGGALGLRSRIQITLLVVSMVGTAWLAMGFPSESLTRSLFAWRNRPRAILLPLLVGLVAAGIFLWLAASILLSFVARFVRL